MALYIIISSRTPEVYAILNTEDISESEDFERDNVNEALDIHEHTLLKLQSCNIENHDVSFGLSINTDYIFSTHFR